MDRSFGCIQIKQLGDNIWSAIDPINEKKRWIIKPCTRYHGYSGYGGRTLFELIHVRLPHKNEISLETSNDPEELKILLFTNFMASAARHKFKNYNMLSLAEREKVDKILAGTWTC